MATESKKPAQYMQLGKLVDGPPTDIKYNAGSTTKPVLLKTGSTSDFINKTYSLLFENGTSGGQASSEEICFTGATNFNSNESWHCTNSVGSVRFTLVSPLPVSFFARITYQQHVDGSKKGTSSGMTTWTSDGVSRNTGWIMNTNQPWWGTSTSPVFRLGGGRNTLQFYTAIASKNGFYLSRIEIVPYNQGKREISAEFYWECIHSIPLTASAGQEMTFEGECTHGVDTTKSQTREFAMDLSLSAVGEFDDVVGSIDASFKAQWTDTETVSITKTEAEKWTHKYAAKESGQLMVWQPIVEYKIGAPGPEQHTIKMRIPNSTAQTFVAD